MSPSLRLPPACPHHTFLLAGVVQAAVAKINGEGGILLGDGTKAVFQVTPFDSACSFTQAKAVLKRLAGADFVMGIGPT
jgi:ABC-type branched-subunit amino acid transport system substrate-binding protein|eukprot:2967323-Prymnesium_polylepis.1